MVIQCIFIRLKMRNMQLFLLVAGSERCHSEISQQSLFCSAFRAFFSDIILFFFRVYIQRNSALFHSILIYLFTFTVLWCESHFRAMAPSY